MTAVAFDTLKRADRLQVGGFTSDQAKATSAALADALSDGFSGDINALKSDVAMLKSDVAMLKSDVAMLESDMSGLKSDAATLKSEMMLLKWMLGFVLVFHVSMSLKIFLH